MSTTKHSLGACVVTIFCYRELAIELPTAKVILMVEFFIHPFLYNYSGINTIEALSFFETVVVFIGIIGKDKCVDRPEVLDAACKCLRWRWIDERRHDPSVTREHWNSYECRACCASPTRALRIV